MELLLMVVTVLAVWILVGVLGLGLCASAARGDRALGRGRPARSGPARTRARFARGMRPAA